MEFGQKIKFTAVYKRMRSCRQIGDSSLTQPTREWVVFLHEQPKQGIVIGKRTLFNGNIFTEDGVRLFDSTESIQAYLVATNMKDNPIYVPMHHTAELPEISVA